jgi:hypothetical protein
METFDVCIDAETTPEGRKSLFHHYYVQAFPRTDTNHRLQVESFRSNSTKHPAGCKPSI